jgi:hypothetical protein
MPEPRMRYSARPRGAGLVDATRYRELGHVFPSAGRTVLTS